MILINQVITIIQFATANIIHQSKHTLTNLRPSRARLSIFGVSTVSGQLAPISPHPISSAIIITMLGRKSVSAAYTKISILTKTKPLHNIIIFTICWITCQTSMLPLYINLCTCRNLPCLNVITLVHTKQQYVTRNRYVLSYSCSFPIDILSSN